MNKKITLAITYLTIGLSAFAQIDFSQKASTSDLLIKLDEVVSSGKYERITSILIAQKGELLFEKYYNGTGQNTLRNTRSVTKTMATLLTGIAIDKGHITSEKDKIFKYLQHKKPLQNPDPRKEDITIEDLITMSSIFECDDNNRFSRGNEERMYIIEDWTSFLLNLPIRSYPWNPPPAEQPYGRSWSYCSAGAAAISEILQTAIGGDLDQFAKQNLFDPLGIKNYKLDHTPQGILNTAGGSNYRSRDFLKLIQMCLNDGMWKNEEIISSSWLKKATTPKASVRDNTEYGYLFWLNKFGQETQVNAFYMSGNGGQKILAVPELDLAVVITTTNYGNRNAHNYTDEIMNKYIVPATNK